jgi:hypothetical protein
MERWYVKGGKKKGKDNSDDEDKTSFVKFNDETKERKKGGGKGKLEKARRRRLAHATFAEQRGTSKISAGRRILHKCLHISKPCTTRRKEQPRKLELQSKKNIYYPL